LLPEAAMVDGTDEGEAKAEVVPTEPALVAGAGGAAGAVVLEYTGALVGATTLEVVTGLTMVQGQLVMVKVVASVTV